MRFAIFLRHLKLAVQGNMAILLCGTSGLTMKLCYREGDRGAMRRPTLRYNGSHKMQTTYGI